jgi:hypothetical protein
MADESVVGCGATCTSICSGTCSTVCGNSCSGGCMGTCLDGCTSSCSDSCASDCTQTCASDCNTTCSNSCSDTSTSAVSSNDYNDPNLDLSRVVRFVITTRDRFEKLRYYNNTYIYFLTDTREIYKGGISFTDVLIKCYEFPSRPVSGKIYYNTNNHQVKYFDKSSGGWITLITPMATSMDDGINSDTDCTVTALGIKNYIDQKFSELYESLGKTAGYNTVPIFSTYEQAVTYANESPLSRPGQVITAPNDEGRRVMYIIQSDNSLVEYPSMAEVKELLKWRTLGGGE